MNKNAREKEFLEEAYASLYERRNPDAGTYDKQAEEPALEVSLDPDEEEEGCPNLNKLIASESDVEDDNTVVARQGRGETAAQFKAAGDTEFG
jgi:hypothetical protein